MKCKNHPQKTTLCITNTRKWLFRKTLAYRFEMCWICALGLKEVKIGSFLWALESQYCSSAASPSAWGGAKVAVKKSPIQTLSQNRKAGNIFQQNVLQSSMSEVLQKPKGHQRALLICFASRTWQEKKKISAWHWQWTAWTKVQIHSFIHSCYKTIF